MDILQVIQIIGAFLILCAFVLLQTKHLKITSTSYLLMNLIGAALLTVAAFMAWQWGFIILETVWALVAPYGLLRKMKHA